MKNFIYVHTGHRIGLDRFRRMAAIIEHLQDMEITLLTSDYRIAGVGRQYGFKKSVGVDIVRNIPQISHHGDKMVFDSDELNLVLLEDMANYFSTFIRMNDKVEIEQHPKELIINPYNGDTQNFKSYAIGDKYFGEFKKNIKVGLFFGDDDYEEDLLRYSDIFETLNPELLLGFYYFLDYEEKLSAKFKTIHEEEDYDEVITQSEVLITSSPQATLESLASGGRPIYIQRADYADDFIPLFESLNIPVLRDFDKALLLTTFDSVLSLEYHKPLQNSQKIAEFIKSSFN